MRYAYDEYVPFSLREVVYEPKKYRYIATPIERCIEIGTAVSDATLVDFTLLGSMRTAAKAMKADPNVMLLNANSIGLNFDFDEEKKFDVSGIFIDNRLQIQLNIVDTYDNSIHFRNLAVLAHGGQVVGFELCDLKSEQECIMRRYTLTKPPN